MPLGTAELIVCYVPELQRDVIEPLRRAGHSDKAICSLGEIPVEALISQRIRTLRRRPSSRNRAYSALAP